MVNSTSKNSRAAMAVSSPSAAALLDLPLEVLTGVCGHLDFRDLIRVAETCKRFRHGDGGLEPVELPTKSPVVTALRERAFPGGVGVPSTRPIGCSESWVAYLARCARQRRCRDAPLIAVGGACIFFLDAAGRLLSKSIPSRHVDQEVKFSLPTPVAHMAGMRMRGVAAGKFHSLALGWDGQLFSWGESSFGQLGHGDNVARPSPVPSPVLVEGLESVRSIAAGDHGCFVVTQSGAVFQWGCALLAEAEDSLRPIIVEGFGGVLVRRVCAGDYTAFAIGDGGEIFSWGRGRHGFLGHGDTQSQPSPKRVEALRGVWVSSVSVGIFVVLALAEDGVVYAWGRIEQRTLLGNPHVEEELLPKPVEALRGVRVGSIAATYHRSYAVSDTGEVWAW
jgi:alpha-tubulin suppressor-like RCC1 family protein